MTSVPSVAISPSFPLTFTAFYGISPTIMEIQSERAPLTYGYVKKAGNTGISITSLILQKNIPFRQTFFRPEIAKRPTNNALRNSRSSENSAKVCKTLQKSAFFADFSHIQAHFSASLGILSPLDNAALDATIHQLVTREIAGNGQSTVSGSPAYLEIERTNAVMRRNMKLFDKHRQGCSGPPTKRGSFALEK